MVMDTPKNIRPITINETADLGIDNEGRLYWKGVPVKTEQTVRLSTWLNTAAIAAGIATVVQAFCSVWDLMR